MDNKKSGRMQEVKRVKERRIFLKKAIYSAPTLVALGTLAKPKNAHSAPTPPSAPEWN